MVILVSFEKNNLKINLVKNGEMNKRRFENMGEPYNCTWYSHLQVKILPHRLYLSLKVINIGRVELRITNFMTHTCKKQPINTARQHNTTTTTRPILHYSCQQTIPCNQKTHLTSLNPPNYNQIRLNIFYKKNQHKIRTIEKKCFHLTKLRIIRFCD